jgi:hypothetical protein
MDVHPERELPFFVFDILQIFKTRLMRRIVYKESSCPNSEAALSTMVRQ